MERLFSNLRLIGRSAANSERWLTVDNRDLQEGTIDRLASLTQGEETTLDQFRQLVSDTNDFLVSIGRRRQVFRATPESARNFLSDYGLPYWENRYEHSVPPELIERWKSWNEEYYRMRARNPHLDLCDMMEWCGETHDFSGWPTEYEADILHWIEHGSWQSPPFDDRQGIVTEAFFERLRELHRLCGGWHFADGFLPDSEGRKRPLLLTLTDWSGREVCAALERAGFKFRFQRDPLWTELRRHRSWTAGPFVAVPDQKQLSYGTLRHILSSAELTMEQFMQLLRK